MRGRYHLGGAAALVVLLFFVALNACAAAPNPGTCNVEPSLDVSTASFHFHQHHTAWRTPSRPLLEPEPRRIMRPAPAAGVLATLVFEAPAVPGGAVHISDRVFTGASRAHVGGRSPPVA